MTGEAFAKAAARERVSPRDEGGDVRRDWDRQGVMVEPW